MNDVTEHWHRLSDGRVVCERRQIVSPVFKEIQALRDKNGGREDPDGYLVARVPVVVLEAFLKREGVTLHDFSRDPTLVKKLVNDPEYKRFRVWQGRM